MPLQHELAWLLSERCEEIGVTPQKLAQLSGVDIQTVRHLLDRTGREVSISNAECMANAVGLSLGVLGHRRRPQNPGGVVAVAARTASTSFKDAIPPDILLQSLRTGIAPTDFQPHLRALLDEAPVGLLSGLAYEVHDAYGVLPRETWRTMRTMAACLACLRDLWN